MLGEAVLRTPCRGRCTAGCSAKGSAPPPRRPRLTTCSTRSALARRGICNLKSQGAFARMPYWLSLFAACQHGAARPGAAEAILDAALADGHAHNDVWWQPE